MGEVNCNNNSNFGCAAASEASPGFTLSQQLGEGRFGRPLRTVGPIGCLRRPNRGEGSMPRTRTVAGSGAMR